MKRISLIRAQKNQANRQKINTRNYTAYEIHKQTIIVQDNVEKPLSYSWDTKNLRWLPYDNKFLKFAPESRADISADAPTELKATSTIELMNVG